MLMQIRQLPETGCSVVQTTAAEECGGRNDNGDKKPICEQTRTDWKSAAEGGSYSSTVIFPKLYSAILKVIIDKFICNEFPIKFNSIWEVPTEVVLFYSLLQINENPQRFLAYWNVWQICQTQVAHTAN